MLCGMRTWETVFTQGVTSTLANLRCIIASRCLLHRSSAFTSLLPERTTAETTQQAPAAPTTVPSLTPAAELGAGESDTNIEGKLFRFSF